MALSGPSRTTGCDGRGTMPSPPRPAQCRAYTRPEWTPSVDGQQQRPRPSRSGRPKLAPDACPRRFSTFWAATLASRQTTPRSRCRRRRGRAARETVRAAATRLPSSASSPMSATRKPFDSAAMTTAESEQHDSSPDAWQPHRRAAGQRENRHQIVDAAAGARHLEREIRQRDDRAGTVAGDADRVKQRHADLAERSWNG